MLGLQFPPLNGLGLSLDLTFPIMAVILVGQSVTLP